MNIKRGDLFYAALDETYVGSEQTGVRPVVIIQNDIGNEYSPTVIIAPITSKVNSKSIIPTHVFIKGYKNRLKQNSLILTEQVRAIDKSRLKYYIGTLDLGELRRVDKSLIISLGIDLDGLTAILGSGFDPGVTSVYSAYALKHYFDEIHTIDILDCNGGDHGYPFATNFNPEINLREVSANGSYWTDGHWVETKPMEWRAQYNFDQVGEKDMYLLHHEEIESLAKNIPGIKRIRFFMTFGQSYLTHMKCLENVGMLRTDPIMVDGKEIVPIQVLKELLPDPASLGPRTVGKTNIGCIFTGVKDGKEKSIYIYNVCDHQECYKEVESQAISYTTGVPAMIGAMMVVKGLWKKPGVFNLEEMDPDPYMEALNKFGLPWQVVENPVPVDCYKTEDESVHMD